MEGHRAMGPGRAGIGRDRPDQSLWLAALPGNSRLAVRSVHDREPGRVAAPVSRRCGSPALSRLSDWPGRGRWVRVPPAGTRSLDVVAGLPCGVIPTYAEHLLVSDRQPAARRRATLG